MDGLLIIDKPVGPTSHDVVARVRRVLGERRIGHTGTLDPAASGVLPLVIGRATRLAQFLSGADKVYEATIKLGVETDTYDSLGQPVGTAYIGALPSRAEIERTLDEFRGTFLQRPPAYSAKKVDGRRSYKIARASARADAMARSADDASTLDPTRADPEPVEGSRQTARLSTMLETTLNLSSLDVARDDPEALEGSKGRQGRGRSLSALPGPVSVTVHAIEWMGMEGDSIALRVTCAAGFYVRSLAHDLGERLGTAAHLSALRRTASGDASIADAIPLARVEHHQDAAVQAIVPLPLMLLQLSSVVLTEEGVRYAVHGRDLGPSVLVGGLAGPRLDSSMIRLLDARGALVGIGERAESSGLLHPCVVLV